MAKMKCNEKDVSIRGGANPQQNEYANTVANYASGSSQGDNIIENVSCDASVTVGSIVRMSGSTAIKAIATSFTNSLAIGICISKSDSTTCNIQVTGYTSSIFGGLDTSKNYFLSDTVAGQLTTTAPTASGSYVIKIGNPISTTQLVITIERIVKRI